MAGRRYRPGKRAAIRISYNFLYWVTWISIDTIHVYVLFNMSCHFCRLRFTRTSSMSFFRANSIKWGRSLRAVVLCHNIITSDLSNVTNKQKMTLWSLLLALNAIGILLNRGNVSLIKDIHQWSNECFMKSSQTTKTNNRSDGFATAEFRLLFYPWLISMTATSVRNRVHCWTVISLSIYKSESLSVRLSLLVDVLKSSDWGDLLHSCCLCVYE